MKFASKMMLVPFQPGSQTQTDQEMSKIVNSKMNPDEKVKIYNDVLANFLASQVPKDQDSNEVKPEFIDQKIKKMSKKLTKISRLNSYDVVSLLKQILKETQVKNIPKRKVRKNPVNPLLKQVLVRQRLQREARQDRERNMNTAVLENNSLLTSDESESEQPANRQADSPPRQAVKNQGHQYKKDKELMAENQVLESRTRSQKGKGWLFNKNYF